MQNERIQEICRTHNSTYPIQTLDALPEQRYDMDARDHGLARLQGRKITGGREAL
jgi:hypothetical protein